MSWTLNVSGHSTDNQDELDKVATVARATVAAARKAGLNPSYAQVGGNGSAPSMSELLEDAPPAAETVPQGSQEPAQPSELSEEDAQAAGRNLPTTGERAWPAEAYPASEPEVSFDG